MDLPQNAGYHARLRGGVANQPGPAGGQATRAILTGRGRRGAHPLIASILDLLRT